MNVKIIEFLFKILIILKYDFDLGKIIKIICYFILMNFVWYEIL